MPHVRVVIGDGLPDGHKPFDGAADSSADPLNGRPAGRLAAWRHQTADLWQRGFIIDVFFTKV